MKLLLDANVSWRLSARLKDHFKEIQHVDFISTTPPASISKFGTMLNQITSLL
jgi:hypothetical protein